MLGPEVQLAKISEVVQCHGEKHHFKRVFYVKKRFGSA